MKHEPLPKNGRAIGRVIGRVIGRLIGRVIGIDWGVNEIATTTDDDYDFPHPERGKSAQARLSRYKRQMARRRPKRGQPASNGYKQAKKDAAKTYRRVARQVT